MTRLFHDKNDRAGNISSVREGGSVHTDYSYTLTGDPKAVYTGTERAHKKQAVQTFEYDAQGNITGIMDGNQNRRSLFWTTGDGSRKSIPRRAG